LETIPENTSPTKLPRVGEVTIVPTPQRAQTTRRFPPIAPVEVCIYRYTDRASDLWDAFYSNDDAPLYQVQVRHQAQKNITYFMRDSFNEFLTSANKEDHITPPTVQALEGGAQVRLVISDKTDPDGIGFEQWRVAFYCSDLANFLLLLDGWLKHKENAVVWDEPLEVEIYPHINVNLQGLVAELNYDSPLACIKR